MKNTDTLAQRADSDSPEQRPGKSDNDWLDAAAALRWMASPTRAGEWSFDEDDFHIRWFADSVLNANASCVDRHAEATPERIAIIWEPDDPSEQPRHISYAELREQVGKFGNLLKAKGVEKRDRVTIYLPMIPEVAFALLACARIGAIHSVVFAGFSPEALAGRILDCDSRVVITADEGRRGGKRVPLKTNVDAAILHTPQVKSVIVVRLTGGDVPMTPGRDHWYHEDMARIPADCPMEPMGAEDPLFIL